MKLTAEATVINDEKLNIDIDNAQTTADEAKATADEAKAIADNTAQYFWFATEGTDTGAHISEVPQGEFETSPNGGNLLARSNGIAVRDGLEELATFGANGTQLGKQDESHANIDYHSMKLTDKEGNTYLYISDLRDRDGIAQITDQWEGDGTETFFQLSFESIDTDYAVLVDGVEVTSDIDKEKWYIEFDTAPATESIITVTYGTTDTNTKAFTLGTRDTSASVGAFSVAIGESLKASGIDSYAEGYQSSAEGYISHAEGERTIASSRASHAEGKATKSTAVASHAEGQATIASGTWSHAEGTNTQATHWASHAEGSTTKATGVYSHAEGSDTKATGGYSHAEGSNTEASSSSAHAEGSGTVASGNASHAGGTFTIAEGNSQTAIGKYNVSDTSSLFIIGNGTSRSARANAFAVDGSGNVKSAGGITAYDHSSPIGTVKDAYMSAAKTVATGTYVALCSISLEAGVWILTARSRAPSNANGWRGMNVMTTSGGSGINSNSNAVNGTYTQLVETYILTPTATTTYYLNVRHNAGSDLTYPAGTAGGHNSMRAVRIA